MQILKRSVAAGGNKAQTKKGGGGGKGTWGAYVLQASNRRFPYSAKLSHCVTLCLTSPLFVHRANQAHIPSTTDRKDPNYDSDEEGGIIYEASE